ncbi:expressed unknown protein [Seminavis robusta]|uniref:Uncharacterized protein n=1 Tax=Seminavis robusta TaxID=568900 RepID=A0A9N8E6B1_9STRA|nr:expressed unknown protein [Seminavis robusta]|eukprot:Sro697_g189070.1 n/a (294) ;mRNA; r:28536-29417
MTNFNAMSLILAIGVGVSGLASAESEPFFCRQATDCGECIQNGCSWAAEQCINSCAEIADVKCYNLEPFPRMSSRQLCAMAEMEKLDDELCSLQEGCFTCTSAIKSNGESCAWYIDESTKMGYCGSGFCDALGNCPVDSCSSLGGGAGELPIPVPLPVDYNCQSRTSCSSCMAGESTCAWAGGRCLDSCMQIADAPCYTHDTFQNNLSGDEICQVVEGANTSQERCQAANSCQQCTNTMKTANGVETCSWYTDGAIGWCGKGGCDMNGICGSSTCSAVQGQTTKHHGSVRGSN